VTDQDDSVIVSTFSASIPVCYLGNSFLPHPTFITKNRKTTSTTKAKKEKDKEG
jgi:hypothetical protein